MKNLLALMLIVVLPYQSNSNITKPEILYVHNQQDGIQSPEIIMLNYLKTNFKQTPDSIFLRKPKWLASNEADTICGYTITFQEGHSFTHEQECNEWGEIVTVNFKGLTSNKVKSLVDQLFQHEGYHWYINQTEYRPEKYYETVWTFRITQGLDSITLEFSYSWI